LFYRLNVIELKLPALRERRQDIGPLAQSFLNRLGQRQKLSATPTLATVTLKYLESYHFPGNVRELENILERAVAFSSGSVINVEDLGLRPVTNLSAQRELDVTDLVVDPSDETAMADDGVRVKREFVMSPEGIPSSLADYLDQLERDAIQRALEKTRFNRTAAAKLLGVSFRALRYRMQRLGIT
jgi:two-component system, NtrC family, response regulator PilR